MELRPLSRVDTRWLRSRLTADPARHCFLLAVLDSFGTAEISTPAGTMVGGFSDGRPVCAYWVGSTVVPLDATAESNALLAAALNAQGRRSCSIVGDAEVVLDLSSRLTWGEPAGVRPDQPLLVLTGGPAVPPHPHVRPLPASEFDAVYPASVAMFCEEVGFSPEGEDGGASYRARVRSLLDQRATLGLLVDRGPDGAPLRRWPSATTAHQVAFKADLGIIAPGSVQIQGVWVHPDFRGRGLGSAGMTAVSAYALEAIAPVVSLYLNAHNAAARRIYEKAGYTQIGTFATVMY